VITQETLFEQAPSPDEPTTSLAEARRAREEEARQDVLQRMKEERAGWLEKMRTELAALYQLRVTEWGLKEAYVTADDARNLMRSYPQRFGLPAGASTNTLGALFLGKEWHAKDGYTTGGRAIAGHTSTTPGSRGNDLVRWEYVGERARKSA